MLANQTQEATRRQAGARLSVQDVGRTTMPGNQPKRDVAILRAFDASGKEVAREELDLYEYWDDLHPLVDSDEHRVSLRVVKLVGDLYGESGLIQHFEVRYGPSGEYLGGRTEHEDGTVTEE